jgi:hypothetical protein
MEEELMKNKPAPEGDGQNLSEQAGEQGMQIPPGSELRNAALQKMQTEAQDKLKEFRVRVDSLYLTAQECLPKGRYASLAVTKYQSARQMLGLVLGEKGAAYPYPSLADNTNKVSGTRADKGSVLPEVSNIVEVVLLCKKLREVTEEVITDLVVFLESPDNTPTGAKDALCSGQALVDLCSAKMQVGEILGEIAEQSAGK